MTCGLEVRCSIQLSYVGAVCILLKLPDRVEGPRKGTKTTRKLDTQQGYTSVFMKNRVSDPLPHLCHLCLFVAISRRSFGLPFLDHCMASNSAQRS